MNTRNVLTLAVLISIGLAASVAAQTSRPTLKSSPARTANQGYTPVTARGQLAGQIIQKWANYVADVYGTSPMAWSKAMSPTFAEADVYNMQRAVKRSTFEGMMSSLKGQTTTDASLSKQLTRTAGNLVALQALGSPASDLVYTAVTPCRIIDTRRAGGPLTPGSTRNFYSSGADFIAQGGAATNCNIPADVAAVVVNVVALEVASKGYITVFPYNQPQPLSSSVNLMPGLEVANELIVTQTQGQAFDFSVFAYAQTQIVGDVAGYFAAPIATALECVSVAGTPTTVPPLGVVTAFANDCPAGFTSTSLRCEQTGMTISAVVASITVNSCVFNNISPSLTSTAVAIRNCCRVPGR